VYGEIYNRFASRHMNGAASPASEYFRSSIAVVRRGIVFCVLVKTDYCRS